MFDRFTDRARRVISLAKDEAERLHHEYVGTEHLLFALLDEGTGVAANVLKNLDLDLKKVRRALEPLVQSEPDSPWAHVRPMTPKAKAAIDFAKAEADGFGHDYVGTEHLLLGLLRDEDTVAAQVLLNFKLSLGVVRQEVYDLLGEPLVQLHRDRSMDVDLDQLPPPAREIVKEFNRQIDIVQEEKDEAIAAQEWEKAAELRALQHKLQRCKAGFVRPWQE